MGVRVNVVIKIAVKGKKKQHIKSDISVINYVAQKVLA